MRVVLSTMLFAWTTAVALPTPALAAQNATTATKSAPTLEDRIEHRIKADSSLKRFNIDVSVDDSVVKLTGTVATEADRAKAGNLAMVSGVSRVDNHLVVDLDAVKGTAGTVERKTKEVGKETKEGASKVVEKTKDGASTVAEKTKDGASTVAEKTKEGLSKTGEVITDAWITGRVNTRFVGEELLKGSDINVDTKDHVVMLMGTVTSAAGRAKAVQIAKDTEGVRQVVDHLTIGPKR